MLLSPCILDFLILVSRGYTRADIASKDVKMDIHDKGYVGRVWLYIFCGLLDSAWQTTVYWLMGTMLSNPAVLAHFVALCVSPSQSLFYI